MILKLTAKYSLVLILIICDANYVLAQTPLSFTSIPISDPDLNAPGRGVEQWHDQNVVNVPTEGINTQRLDVYHRFVWTKIEGPTMGSYTWRFFDSLVNDAISRKQKMSFGIMPLYPGGTNAQGLVTFNDGGLASYPLYLHNLMQSETPKDWKTGNVWTPNYNSTYYTDRLLALHKAIDGHIKATSFNGVPYSKVINCIDLRGYGAWGEWHSGYTPNNVVSDYPAGTFPSIATLKKIVDAHTQGFPDFPLVAMIAAFDANYLPNTMNPPEIAWYVLTQAKNNSGPIGWRRDQWGATDSYISNYLENNTRSYNGFVFKDAIMARWKIAPITGEPPGWTPSKFSDLERQIRLYHATSFGNGNYGGTPTSTVKSNVRAASKACGYRLIIEGGSTSAGCNNNISITLNWKNIGLTPTYENWNVEFKLKNSNNAVVWSGLSAFNPRLFLPASNATSITDNFTLPSGVSPGTYTLSIIIKDPNEYRDPLPLAIAGRNSDGSYTIGQISTLPVLSSNLSATATTGTPFSYHPTSSTPNITFSWRRDAVTGISNPSATGSGDINETLLNTTGSPVNVTYVYTLATTGCTNTQNVVVTVNPSSSSPTNCVSNVSVASGFNSTAIAANRFIWFSSVMDPGKLSGVSGTVTFTVTNGRISFSANNQSYTLNVPDAKIRFDAGVSNATSQFVNNAWETTIPKSNNGFIFLAGLSYQVPANLPGNISNVTWSAKISIDKANITPTWKWAAAVYSTLGSYSTIGVKPRDNKDRNLYNNNDNAGTPENYKSSVVSGAKGTGGSNYTGDYSNSSSVACSTTGQRSAQPTISDQVILKQIPRLSLELLSNEKFHAVAWPNPSNSSFNLLVNGKIKNPVSIKVIDISGRVVERHDKVSPNSLLNLGQSLAAGSYFIEIIQDDQKKIINVVKVY